MEKLINTRHKVTFLIPIQNETNITYEDCSLGGKTSCISKRKNINNKYIFLHGNNIMKMITFLCP